MLKLCAVLATTPRVGQNAVLGALTHINEGAGEYGMARAVGRVLILSAGYPVPLPRARQTRYIRISRDDKVAQAISWSIAGQNGQFHSNQRPGPDPVVFDAANIEKALEAIERGEKQWDYELRGENTLNLVYEADIEQNPTFGAEKVRIWLGLPGKCGKTRFSRVGADLKADWRKKWDLLDFQPHKT